MEERGNDMIELDIFQRLFRLTQWPVSAMYPIGGLSGLSCMLASVRDRPGNSRSTASRHPANPLRTPIHLMPVND
jgi:hypothetical protein